MAREIFLVYPSEKTHFTRLPISLLGIATVLDKEGYEVKIIDMRFQDYKKFDYTKALFLGITSMTGNQLKYALEISCYVKKNYPDVKVVWGGIHASLLPEQTIKNKNIDIIVKGEGELTCLELAKALEQGKSGLLKKIKGLVYKNKGEIITTGERPFLDLDKLPFYNYNLFDLSKAKTSLGDFPLSTSRGCPHRCKFCYNLNFNKRRWRAMSAGRVIEEIKRLYKKRIRKIEFTEDEFFVNEERVKKIAESLIKDNLKIEWTTSCRFDYLARYDLNFLRLLRKSGCKMLMLGGESGSEKILRMIDKDISIRDITEGVKKCKTAGILTQTSFMCGFPDETKEDILKTINIIDKIHKIDRKAEINGLFGFTPYPGTPLFEEAIKAGAKLPNSLESWINYNFSSFEKHAWLNKKYKKWLETITAIVRFNYFNQSGKVYENLNPKVLYLPYFIFNNIYKISAILRWKFRAFSLGFEWVIWTKIKEKYLGHF